ncbi:MAG: bifunctional phosphopantothenoylcysteine decarboxylase/phosphopantothenate--cysteine ligase CoaBC [Coriobacteriales bacterium]|jgi:phosphopantothenoylcysteine decarboxylase/phosphopantothenate--cysteine ligase|nr:bifunctional phosphopantothenoylcysteine decarboxylase/phosphopantothenate--cysteine ligase CoaBC [Coriobacteriales bacterium]
MTADANSDQPKVTQRTILLGVTGSIAAYKACELVRQLQKTATPDTRIKVVMTKHGAEFVTPATFKALTGEPVAINLVDEPNAPVHHISLAKEASILVIAPATANILNKIANGVADDLLTTTVLSAWSPSTGIPLVIAPAMNAQMWRNPATQDALQTLSARGAIIVQPETGYLACGDSDEGRLANVEKIAAAILDELSVGSDLVGKNLLVNAGPTREYLDPVRFISSPSSGLTGYLVAYEAARRGASVTLVSGPVSLPLPKHKNISLVQVTSALEMLDACQAPFSVADAAVFTAAVADFRPQERFQQKIKKHTAETQISLVANPDIVATLTANHSAYNHLNKPSANLPYIVAFAAETENIIDNAHAKLLSKKADLIVANDVSVPGLGFASKQNKVWFVSASDKNNTKHKTIDDEQIKDLSNSASVKVSVSQTNIVQKTELARIIVNKIVKALSAKATAKGTDA